MSGVTGRSEVVCGGGGQPEKGGRGDQLLADCNANQWLPVSGLCLRRLSSP